LSSIVRLLIEHPPLDNCAVDLIQACEKQVSALFVPLGDSIAQEQVPLSSVVLVVEGSLRVFGRDASGQEFTLRRVLPGQWWGGVSALNGLAAAGCRTSADSKILVVPAEVWERWWRDDRRLGEWLAQHSQREDLYSALRSLLVQRELQDLSLPELLDKIQPIYLFSEVLNVEDLNRLIDRHPQMSWFPPFPELCFPDLGPPSSRGFNASQLRDALDTSPRGLRLVGIPVVQLQALLEAPKSRPDDDRADPVLVEQPAWQNPDGSELLTLAMQQDQGPLSLNRKNLQVKTVFGSTPVEQGLALLQMVCEVLQLPFRRDVVDRMLNGMVGARTSPSLENLGQIADALGLTAVMMQVPASHLHRVSLPALVETVDGVLLLAGEVGQCLRLIDPREGERLVGASELQDQQPTYRLITLSRRVDTATKRFDISYFFPFLRRYKSSLVLVFVASIFINIFGLAQPLIIQQIIDKVIGQQNFSTLYFLGVMLIGVSILSNILNLIRTFLFTDTTNRIDIATSGNILTHLFRLPLNYFDKRPVGEISTRIGELGNIRGFLTGTALTLILDVIFGFVYLFVCLSYSGLLTAVALGVVPLYLALVYVIAPIIKKQLRIAAEANAAASALMVEALNGMQTVKAQHAETTIRWRWQQRYARFVSSNFRTTIIGATAGSIGAFFNEVGGLAVLWVGAYLVLQGELTIGQLIAFRIISGNVVGPVIRLAQTWQTVQGLQISVERLADVVDAEPEQPLDSRPIALPPINGKIEFDQVDFRFNEHAPLVVKQVSFTIEPGQFIGIVGQSGSGKSTIMKLLPRMYKAASGSIRIDDYDISKVDIDSLRQQIGIVPQDSMLFDGSIRDNIALNSPDSTDEDIIYAAKVACAHAFIMDLPNGYDSRVGERGSALSGGQRQRVAIARAILARPRLLILDEATSALDYLTERTVCENLRRELKGDTVFFITHRLGTIRNADNILLMDSGLLQETGSHAELLKKRGLYYALYRQQDASVN
jgi:subfamily B ATP-binding cassette protein HlyB/CyaB